MSTLKTIIPLPEAFFAEDSVSVARALLGHLLIRRSPEGILSRYRIVETEAYTEDDPACHAFGKSLFNAGRAATLFKSPGLAYVYLIYGMYHCLNVVTEPEGRAGAVLFRALEPVRIEPEPESPKIFATRGPGKLCKALEITKVAFNERSLLEPESSLFLAEGCPVNTDAIKASSRIGIRHGLEYHWRFFEVGNPWVSCPPAQRKSSQV